MKTLHLVVLLLFCFTYSSAQNTLVLSYNNVEIGRNFSLGIEKKIKRHAFFIAAKCHVNRLRSRNNVHFFKKRFYARDVFENFAGLQFSYRYDLIKTETVFHPFYFSELQVTYAHIRNVIYTPYDFYGIPLYKQQLHFLGPFLGLELYNGFGFKIDVNDKISLYQTIGAGAVFVLGKDEKTPKELYKPFQCDFGGMFSVGIGYKIGKKKAI